MKSIYCEQCGLKLLRIKIPRSKENHDWEIFDEKTGKRIIDTYDVCMNSLCNEGKENICIYTHDGHTYSPRKAYIATSAFIIFLVCLFAGLIFRSLIIILAFPGLIATLIAASTGQHCLRCHYYKSSDF